MCIYTMRIDPAAACEVVELFGVIVVTPLLRKWLTFHYVGSTLSIDKVLVLLYNKYYSDATVS